MIQYVLLGAAAIAILALASIPPERDGGEPSRTSAPSAQNTVQMTPSQQMGQPAPADEIGNIDLIGPILPGLTGQIPQQSSCSEMDNKINAERWLIAYCPEYFDNSCGSPTYRGYTMTGDGTYFIEYTALCFKEGHWGIPVPTTMTFNIVMKDCHVVSYSYR